MALRSVRRVHPAQRDDIADLVTRRPLPGPQLERLDPFLFLNHHGPQRYPPHNHGLPFGPHPHRGFETVTFILEGDLLHRDTGGHESVIERGGIQWMTAGRGLEHAELSSKEFMERGGPLEILQLWLNLPARLKMTAPRYVGLQQREIPALELDRSRVQLIAGQLGGLQGPVKPLTDVELMTVDVHGRLRLPAPAGRSVFLYVVRGDLTGMPAFNLVELNDDGDEVALEGDGLVLFGHATPYGEPVVSYGPFVMNSQEEIRQAVLDHQAGRFGHL